MTYVFDIDGTICTQATVGNYESVEPITERIEHINELYDAGHKIIYFTARGMGRHKNNAVLAIQDFYNFTDEQLKSWGAKYHQLILGKPDADLFVDDKGINSDEFFGN